MTRYRINLATQPYQDARRFYTTWGTVLGVVALLTIALLVGAFKSWGIWRSTTDKVRAEQKQLDKLNEQQQQDLSILNRPENRDVRAKSQFINELIHRKEFSWTLIFADLEKIMPTRLQVTAIAPQLDEEGHIKVHMLVAGDTRAKALELVQKMEESSSFHQAEIIAETSSPARNPGDRDVHQFEILAYYQPRPALAPAGDKTPAEKSDEGGGQ